MTQLFKKAVAIATVLSGLISGAQASEQQAVNERVVELQQRAVYLKDCIAKDCKEQHRMLGHIKSLYQAPILPSRIQHSDFKPFTGALQNTQFSEDICGIICSYLPPTALCALADSCTQIRLFVLLNAHNYLQGDMYNYLGKERKASMKLTCKALLYSNAVCRFPIYRDLLCLYLENNKYKPRVPPCIGSTLLNEDELMDYEIFHNDGLSYADDVDLRPLKLAMRCLVIFRILKILRSALFDLDPDSKAEVFKFLQSLPNRRVAIRRIERSNEFIDIPQLHFTYEWCAKIWETITNAKKIDNSLVFDGVEITFDLGFEVVLSKARAYTPWEYPDVKF